MQVHAKACSTSACYAEVVMAVMPQCMYRSGQNILVAAEGALANGGLPKEYEPLRAVRNKAFSGHYEHVGTEQSHCLLLLCILEHPLLEGACATETEHC
jgi:hypothetical protein